MKDVILTGLRANNDLHIGSYFGAIRPIVEMAKQKSADYQINMFIPDLHSFTTPIDHSQLKAQILNNARIYTALGLPLDDPMIHLYRQSYIPAHSELTVILNSFTGMGELQRMTQYKDKSNKLGANQVSVGLFDYPVLMASDILLYSARYVPVGEDQSQHLEFTRDIAQRMNNRFGDLFVVPEPVEKQHHFFDRQALRIKDLVDPTKKMSKSDETGSGVIFLGDSPETAIKKIMRAETDDFASVNYDPDKQPGISNLLDILSQLRTQPVNKTLAEFQGMNKYSDFKTIVARETAEFLETFQANLDKVDTELVLNKLADSERSMNEQANLMLSKVQIALGIH